MSEWSCAGRGVWMAPRLARGSKRRAWTLIPQQRQYQLNTLRHKAEKCGRSGGYGRRGACERSCKAAVHAWRMSSAVWSAPCRRGVQLLNVPLAGGAIRTSPGSGCGAVEETRPRDAVMTPAPSPRRETSSWRPPLLLCIRLFFGQKALVRRDWSAGAAGRRAAAQACVGWWGSLERRDCGL